jgi:ribosomal protein S18 acetylase RimI-like enzyme
VTSLEFHRLDAAGAREARNTVEAVFRGAYWKTVDSGDPFDTPEAFMERFDTYASNPGLDLVIAFEDSHPVGQAWGWPLGPESRWWEGLESDPEPGFTEEDGTRTFALSEIMVVRGRTGRGVAHALHDGLLSGRKEKRATLLVEPDNTNAYRAYIRWGWRLVSRLRPHWPDAPRFDVLVLPLPLARV